MKKLYYTLLSINLILCATAYGEAGEGTFLKYSVSAKGELHSVKGLSMGYQDQAISVIQKKYELGFFSDSSGRAGAKSSGYVSYSYGIEPTEGALYVNFFQGICLISHPDSQLGGPVQFMEDFGLGIRDQKTKAALGFHYKHISSAGFYQPNVGRDLFGLQVMIPW